MKKEFESNGGKWKEFKIGELFEWQAQKEFSPLKIKSLTVKNGKKYPFYGQSTSNKGIISYECLDESVLNNKNWKPIILIHSNNQNCVYLQTPFYLKDGHGATSVLSCHFLNEKNAQFLITCIQKIICKKFSYNNKATKIALKNTFIFLPATRDGTPDFSYMERYIGELEQARVSELAAYLRAAGLENYDLTAAEQNALDDFKNNRLNFKEFKIGELFSVSSNPQLNKESFHFSTNGQYPYFTRTVFNNGILGYVDYLDDEHKISGNSIAVGMLGMQFFYMPSDFYAGQFTKTVFPKFKKFNEKLAIYFIAFFNKFQKILQGVLVRDFEKIFCESKMLLPATRNGTPDFAFMESFITAQQKLAIGDVVLWKDKVISETRKITKV